MNDNSIRVASLASRSRTAVRTVLGLGASSNSPQAISFVTRSTAAAISTSQMSWASYRLFDISSLKCACNVSLVNCKSHVQSAACFLAWNCYTCFEPLCPPSGLQPTQRMAQSGFFYKLATARCGLLRMANCLRSRKISRSFSCSDGFPSLAHSSRVENTCITMNQAIGLHFALKTRRLILPVAPG